MHRPQVARAERSRTRVTLAVLVLASLAIASVRHEAARWLLAAATTAVGASALGARGERRPFGEREVWAWFRRALAVLTTGLLAEAITRALAPQAPAVGFTAGAALAGLGIYQGLVRWNRYRTSVSDPGDWLNGLGSVLAALALTYLLVDQVPALRTIDAGVLGTSLVRVAVATILLGTALTVTAIADLRRDRRVLAIALAVATTLATELTTVAVAAWVGQPVATWAPMTAWALLAAAVVAASVRTPALSGQAQHASPHATTWGSVVVIVAGAAILLADHLVLHGSGLVAGLAMTAILASAFRVSRLVHDLEVLATSRVEARTDPLTGVANRRALLEAVDTFSGRPQGAALLVIDLDRFKDVNDRHGHAIGDLVVKTIAERLATQTAELGLFARLGGDEFAVVLEDPDPAKAVDLAESICTVVREPLQVDGRTIRLDASIGVASTQLSAHRDGELLRCADTAMYVAKRRGGGVQAYDALADERTQTRHELLEELHAMLSTGSADHGRLVLHYQPQLTPADGRVVAVEALVRWEHPRRGTLGPAQFLDLVEERGLMTPLTSLVLDQATSQAARWMARGLRLPVSVNLSASCLEYPGLLAVLRRTLDRNALPADLLVVEVTETTLMRDPDLAIEVTRQISGLGIEVSIDDYGTGYSSLAYLDDLPARELKLDRTFTAKLTSEPRTRAIVSGTIDLAHRIGLRVVAEGVEDAHTLHVLAAMGCDRTQGYFHARPQPAESLERWIRDASVRTEPVA